MNILIINSEGPDAIGLKVLRDAIEHHWSDAKITTIVPREKESWGSIGVRHPNLDSIQKEDMDRQEPGFYIVDDCTATDIVDLAFLHQDWFSPTKKSFDIVVAGVCPGSILGMDVFKSSSVGACMYAAAAYNCSGYTFAQDMGEHDGNPNLPIEFYRIAQVVLPDYLRTSQTISGECWVVNFPVGPPNGYNAVPTAHYSPRRMPPLDIVPRARDERTDVSQLQAGFVTCALLGLRASQSLKY